MTLFLESTVVNEEQQGNGFSRYIKSEERITPVSSITLSPSKTFDRYPESPIDGRPKPILPRSSASDTEPDSKKSDNDRVISAMPVRPVFDDSDSSAKPISDGKTIASNHIHEDKSPSILIKSVPLTSSLFANKIHEQQEQIEESFTKARRFTINFPDGRSQGYIWRCERLYEQLRRIFDENEYDSNNFIVVDNNQIFIDFTNNNRLPHRLTPQYYIIQRDLLISIHFYYRNNSYQYLITPNCETTDIIDHFMGENNVQLTSSDVYFCFFDKFGKTIEGGKMNEILKVNNNSLPFQVTVEEMASSTSTLCEITIQLSKGKYRVSQKSRVKVNSSFSFNLSQRVNQFDIN